jgi:hypothetical protein
MNYVKQGLIYIVAFLVVPYFLTMNINLASIMFVLLLIAYPLLILIVSAIFNTKKFDVLVGLIPAGIFLICLILYLNSSAWVYCIAYFVIGIIGNYLGKAMK